MIQSIVSTDEPALYLDTHQRQPHLLTILVHPTDRVYIVDLPALSNVGAGLDSRQDFALVQLEATTGIEDLARRKSLEVGKLPSLRRLLESPSVVKVVFDSSRVATALSRDHGVLLRGVADIQLMEAVNRCQSHPDHPDTVPNLQFHRTFVARRRPRHVERLRDLRTCLE